MSERTAMNECVPADTLDKRQAMGEATAPGASDGERLQLAKEQWARRFRSRVAAMTAVLSLDPAEDGPTPPTDD
jgi:hypothetical protein